MRSVALSSVCTTTIAGENPFCTCCSCQQELARMLLSTFGFQGALIALVLRVCLFTIEIPFYCHQGKVHLSKHCLLSEPKAMSKYCLLTSKSCREMSKKATFLWRKIFYVINNPLACFSVCALWFSSLKWCLFCFDCVMVYMCFVFLFTFVCYVLFIFSV